MPKLRAILLLITTAALANAGEFLPLQTGNTWTYRENATGQSFTVSVGVPFLIEETVYHSLRGYVSGPVLVRFDEAQNQIVYFDEERRLELPFISFAPFESGWWNAPLRPCEEEGQTAEKPGRHDGAAGSIPTLDIRYRSLQCADTGVASEQFAANLGMLRRTVHSLAGPRDFDLVYARVGNLRLGALPQAAFTASADLHKNSEWINLTMRLETNSNPIRLRFRSGQEYDAVLRDPEGAVVWTWSDGMLFTQSTHELEISEGWSATVRMPRPVLPGPEPKPGVYTVEAWLTTEPGSPRYAVTLPFITPGYTASANTSPAGGLPRRE